MFDKNLFDRNAYDRSVSSDGINGTLFATSSMRTSIVIAYPIPFRPINGTGSLTPGLRLETNVGIQTAGVGEFEETPIVLRMAISCKMTSSGALKTDTTVITPIQSIKFSGTSEFKSRSDYLKQHMQSAISGAGVMRGDLVIQTPLEIPKIEGVGNATSRVDLLLPLTINLASGMSELILRRLSALSESLFELDGINLMPGESVTIDTDLLIVLFGNKEDVSAVTTDSVFFEMSPGENDIFIETDSGGALNVTAIWQNRWL